MASLFGFDASQVPEQQEFSALPEGQYAVIAISSEMKPTKAGTGQYLQIVFEVLDGPQKGRKLWARMNLVNPNQTAVEIAQRELAALCRAVGVIKPSDSAELHNKPLMVEVAVEVDDRRRESNVIKKYLPATGAPAPQPTGQSAFAPPGQQPAPQPAPAPAAGATPPWRK